MLHKLPLRHRIPAMKDMTPKQIVAELDKYIIGQSDAKRAVAVAMRNRWRRQQLAERNQQGSSRRRISS